MDSPIQIGLLGPFRLERHGSPITGLKSRKAVAILGYLVAMAQRVPREHLIDVIWPRLSEQRGRANLSVVLHNLGRLLPKCIDADRQTIAFSHPPGVEVDTLSFTANMNAGGVEEMEAAVRLYRGEFLAGLYLDDCADFELWLNGQRDAWRARTTQALDWLIGYYTATGDFTSGLRHATRLIEVEPWREDSHRHVMWLLACDGQRTAALRHYETCRKILARALGVAPSPETDELLERIRGGEIESRLVAGSWPLEASTPHNLPVQLTAFFGRRPELATLAVRLADPGSRLVTLVGPGGSGKTRLALTAAAAHLAAFSDGVYYVPLAGVPSSRELASAIMEAVPPLLAGKDEPRAQLLRFLKDRQMLLLLDSFEHLVDGSELLVAILQTAPRVKLLVTSRQPLNLRAEWLLRVEGLPISRGGENEPSHDSSAMGLFVDRARHVDGSFMLDEVTRAAVARVCELVDGLPLAIELASAWTAEMPCQRIATDIAVSLDGLDTSMADVSPRHRNMRAVFEQSWRLLAPHDRMALAQLAVFQGGFTLEAANQVAGVTADALDRLHRGFFLHRPKPDRYGIHRLLRQFALEKLDLGEPDGGLIASDAAAATSRPGPTKWPDPEMVRQRHARFFASVAAEAGAELQGPRQRAWLDRLAGEHDNLRASLHWASAHDDGAAGEIGLRLCIGLSRFWMNRGFLTEGRQFIAAALDHAGVQKSTPHYAQGLHTAGYLAWSQGDYETARAYFERSLESHRRFGDKAAEATLVHNLAAIAQEMGDLRSARALLEESLSLKRALGDRPGIAISLNNLGLLADQSGDHAGAHRLYAESLEIARALGDDGAVARTLNNLGVLAENEGDAAAALRFHEESLTIRRTIGDQIGIARSLGNIGVVRELQGDVDGAERCYRESLVIARELGDKRAVANALSNLADLDGARANYESARALAEESLRIRAEMGDRRRIASSLESIARRWTAQGRAGQAAQLFGAAGSLRRFVGAPPPPGEAAANDRMMGELRRQLDPDAFAARFERGAAMTIDDALVYALRDERR